MNAFGSDWEEGWEGGEGCGELELEEHRIASLPVPEANLKTTPSPEGHEAPAGCHLAGQRW